MATTRSFPDAVRSDSPELARDRVRYLIASGIALWGAQLGVVAIPLTAVASLSADARGTALLAATAAVPFVLLGLPVGAWLDRVRRRPVMITADVVRAATLITVPVADWAGALTFVQLWCVVLINGVATVFFDLGTQSHLKDLAPGEQLMRANGKLATLSQTALICAPPLAGWAAGVLTAPVVLAVTAAGYACSAVWLGLLRSREVAHASRHGRRNLMVEIRDGLRFVRHEPVLLTVLAAGCLVNFGNAAYVAVLPVYALRDLGWSESDLGLYLGAGGIGGLLGALSANKLAGLLGAGRSVLAIGIAIAPLAAVLPFTTNPIPGPVSAVAWALIIYKIGFDAVVMMSFRQAVTPAHLLGRVNGTMRVFLTAAVALDSSAAGLAATLFGNRGAVVMVALVLALVWVPIAMSPMRRMQTLTVDR